MTADNYLKTTNNRKDWHQHLIRKLGIVDEGDIVSLIDIEERAEFDKKILNLLERSEHYGRGL